MNRRQKKNFLKKKGLKSYNTLDEIHSLHKQRICVCGKWVTASLGVIGYSRNHRFYNMEIFKEVISNLEIDNACKEHSKN